MASLFTLILLLHHSLYAVQSVKVQNATGEFYINYPMDINCVLDRCFVICNEENGCANAKINAKDTKALIIECTATRSCDSMSITHGSSRNISIKCTGDMACVDAQFETHPAIGIHLRCINKINEADANIPCYRTSLSTKFLSAVAEVSCQGSPGCKFVNFDLTSFKSYVFMQGNRPMYASRVNASGSAFTSLICVSSDHVSSTEYNASQFWIPATYPLSLYFYGAGCKPFGTLFTSGDFSKASVNITGCGDSKCSSGAQCLPSFDLQCNGGKKDSYEHGVCGSSQCGCDTLVEKAQSNYVKYDDGDMCSTVVPSSEKKKSSKASLSGGAIASIVIGVLVLIAVIFGVIWCLVLPTVRDRKKYGAPFLNHTDELGADKDTAGDYSAPNESI